MTKLETTFGQTYHVKETPAEIAAQAAKGNVLHLTRANGKAISINALQLKQ